ncbi:microtubule-associated serine/threonine-protein kinase 2-like [Phyllobates terribilis]|uniref:microtubule-associated serine/threonine-protein kinase 2-like n=1 Tax=Phyllobates terribilis TaxID=111132 RepID=UPI003CCA9027
MPKTNIYKELVADITREFLDRDIIWDCNSAPTPNAQNLITELLRTNPADRLGTGGSLGIKSHPFLSDFDFDNLLSQKPEYIPQLASDVDTSLFIDHSEIDHSVSEDEEDTSENNESLDFQNFTSSSERLSKLCTITNRTMKDEDQKSPPECTPAANTNISEMQKESFSESDSDDAINSLPSSSPSSGFMDPNYISPGPILYLYFPNFLQEFFYGFCEIRFSIQELTSI